MADKTVQELHVTDEAAEQHDDCDLCDNEKELRERQKNLIVMPARVGYYDGVNVHRSDVCPGGAFACSNSLSALPYKFRSSNSGRGAGVVSVIVIAAITGVMLGSLVTRWMYPPPAPCRGQQCPHPCPSTCEPPCPPPCMPCPRGDEITRSIECCHKLFGYCVTIMFGNQKCIMG